MYVDTDLFDGLFDESFVAYEENAFNYSMVACGLDQAEIFVTVAACDYYRGGLHLTGEIYEVQDRLEIVVCV